MSQAMSRSDDAQHYAVLAEAQTVATFTDEGIAKDFAARCRDRTLTDYHVTPTDERLTSRGGCFGVRLEGQIEASFGSREIAEAYVATMDQLAIGATVVAND